MVSHELKAPIAAVYGFLKLFNDDSIKLSGEQRKEYENRSMVRLDGLLKMVNDLLDISRMELKTVKREIKEINIPDIIHSVLELFQLEIKNKKLEVNLNIEQNVHNVLADADEINRLFTNLISNAIKYNN
jgi:signal transduction histidine kinase